MDSRSDLSEALEPHYTLAEIARMWKLSLSTVLRLFREEPGVLRIGNTNSKKREKVSIRIPASVAIRVHERLTSG